MMNAIEIRNLTKVFGNKRAVDGLNMTVPAGAVYGFIGENGSGKSTTEKIICGLMNPADGIIRLFEKDYKDIDVRNKLGVLIESPGCFPNYSVWNNMMLQAKNLRIKNAEFEIQKILKLVRMEGSASNKYKNCSLGMKQRIGIAMALIGNPKLLILDEPINGLDADGMRIMRDIICDLSQNHGVTFLISSHILGELEKIATHYGIIKGGKMICEMTASKLEEDCRTYVGIKIRDMTEAKKILKTSYTDIREENGYIRVYDSVSSDEVAELLYNSGHIVTELGTAKISLEEYYIDIMGEVEHYE